METSSRRVAWLAGAFFALWGGLAMAAAFPGNEWLRGLFTSACHQIPGRCYQVEGHPAGLCVRCLWLYFGLALGHPFFAMVRLERSAALRLLGLAAFLMCVDVALELLGLYHNWKPGRALTGGLGGLACSWFTLRGFTGLYSEFKTKNHPTRYEFN